MRVTESTSNLHLPIVKESVLVMSNGLYVTLKVSLRCNFACRYCYGRENEHLGEEMTDEEVIRGLDFICQYAKMKSIHRIFICWHGGEPLIIGKSRLEKLLDYAAGLFEKNSIRCMFGIQTNGFLLNESLYPLFRQYFDSNIGVSVDLYSKFRKLLNGKDSTPIVLRKIEDALNAGIKINVINLLTKHNVSHIEEIYDYYKKRDIDVRFAMVFPLSNNFDRRNPMYLSSEEYADALCQYFDLWAKDSNPAKNTDIIRLISDMLYGKPSICIRGNNCQNTYMAFSPNGKIFPCAEFDTEDSVIGNFLSQSPEEFDVSNTRQLFYKQTPIPSNCLDCKFYKICFGSCLRERFVLKYPYRCDSNRIYWGHVLKWLESKGGSLYLLENKTVEERKRIIQETFKR